MTLRSATSHQSRIFAYFKDGSISRILQRLGEQDRNGQDVG